MRILHVLNYGWPRIDGYAIRSFGMLTAQRRQLGADVRVVVSPYPPFARAEDRELRSEAWGPEVQVRAGEETPARPRWADRVERPALGIAPWRRAEFAAALERIVDEVEPDVVHAHHPHYVGAPAITIARTRGIPAVYELRCFNGDYDLDARNPYVRARGHRVNRLELSACRGADAVVTISDGLRRRIVAGGVAPERVFVVRNSVDDERFRPRATVRAADGTLHVGYATTFEKIEGLDVLVRAAAAARDAVAAGGRRLRVTLAGTGRDHARIAALVADLGLDDTVALPGFVPYERMPELLHGLDLFVVSRRAAAVAADTTPLKPLEALAAGLPLLCTDLPALRELLGDRAQVRFVAPGERGLADGLAAFARAPWPGDPDGDVGERTWRAEVERYRGVYATAAGRSPAAAEPVA